MPWYEFECKSCPEVFTVVLKVDDRNLPQECPVCKSLDAVRTISNTGFILVGDNWPGKAIKIKSQMKTKNEGLKIRQKERYGDPVKLTPNVGGEQVGSWSEAQKIAKEAGKDTSSYESHIQKENKG